MSLAIITYSMYGTALIPSCLNPPSRRRPAKVRSSQRPDTETRQETRDLNRVCYLNNPAVPQPALPFEIFPFVSGPKSAITRLSVSRKQHLVCGGPETSLPGPKSPFYIYIFALCVCTWISVRSIHLRNTSCPRRQSSSLNLLAPPGPSSL